jgi:hypothetical protein
VLQDARGFSTITNPYGLLRSPWNTNPVPFLMRSNETFFDFGDSFSSFPTCSEFSEYVNSSLADVAAALDGQLHGPVHLMIGGHWGAKHNWKSVGAHEGIGADLMLLLAKVLWREGFARTPEVCSQDTPASECMPSCPASIVTPNGEEMTPALAESILTKVKQTRVLTSAVSRLFLLSVRFFFWRCGSFRFGEIELLDPWLCLVLARALFRCCRR